MHLMKKKVVIFDMDGTMIDSEYPYFLSLSQACEEYNVSISEQEYFNNYAGGKVAENEKHLGKKIQNDEIAKKVIDRARKLYFQKIEQGVEPKPTLIETLDALADQGLRLFVASSSTEDVVRRILSNDVKIIDRFEGIVAGDHVSHSKPDPEIFNRALEVADVDASEAFIIEDSFQGVEAGYRSGTETIMIPDHREPTDEVRDMAFAVVPQLIDIVSLVY